VLDCLVVVVGRSRRLMFRKCNKMDRFESHEPSPQPPAPPVLRFCGLGLALMMVFQSRCVRNFERGEGENEQDFLRG
jgi:hypothetical protein